ncbi:hypothetical protein [Dyella sp.]|uniref:hypothetical protein n=1 Tax=Dyella sp. TaxID=1869338 RepID=UPI00284012AE|nr:hypothetical protein [Dyella sp.]MDR3446668.1 hypothetical protein [Dyella sp.]
MLAPSRRLRAAHAAAARGTSSECSGMNRPDFNDRVDACRPLWIVATAVFFVLYVAVLCGWRA